MSQRRVELVNRAFTKMDRNRDGEFYFILCILLYKFYKILLLNFFKVL